METQTNELSADKFFERILSSARDCKLALVIVLAILTGCAHPRVNIVDDVIDPPTTEMGACFTAGSETVAPLVELARSIVKSRGGDFRRDRIWSNGGVTFIAEIPGPAELRIDGDPNCYCAHAKVEIAEDLILAERKADAIISELLAGMPGGYRRYADSQCLNAL